MDMILDKCDAYLDNCDFLTHAFLSCLNFMETTHHKFKVMYMFLVT